jgi:hypothetical protein
MMSTTATIPPISGTVTVGWAALLDGFAKAVAEQG